MRGMDGATAQRSDTRGRAGEAAAMQARPHCSEQVEQAHAAEGEAVRERVSAERKGGRKSVFSPEDYFVSHFTHPECWEEQQGGS